MMSLIFVFYNFYDEYNIFFYTVNVFIDLIFFVYDNVGNVYDESLSFFVRICTYCMYSTVYNVHVYDRDELLCFLIISVLFILV